MKTKQLIERNLPFSGEYVYLGITRGSIDSGMLTSCDNCGKLITNMVQMGCNKTGKRFTIGVDCCETLIKASKVFNGSGKDYQTDIYSFNVVTRFITEVNAGCEFENDGFYCRLINRKGKAMHVFTNNVKEYYPEILEGAKV